MEEKEESFAMVMLKELSQQNKSMVNIIVKIIVIFSILLLSTNLGWIWYLNQYDYSSETYEETYLQDGEGDNKLVGDNGDIGGDINNGTKFDEENNSQEKN